MEIRPLTRAEAATVPGMVSPMPESLLVMGCVDEKGVAAAVGLFFVVHADPLWVREDRRHSGKLLMRLIEAGKAAVRDTQMGPEVVVSMTPTNPGPPAERVVERVLRAIGGSEVDGRFFAVPVR